MHGQLLKAELLQSRPSEPVIPGSFLTCRAWDSGSTLVHPFRALGKNSELLVVSDKADVASWQGGSLPLHWASRRSSLTATEANHTRYVTPRDTWYEYPNMCGIVFKVYLFDWKLKLSPHFKVLLLFLCLLLL